MVAVVVLLGTGGGGGDGAGPGPDASAAGPARQTIARVRTPTASARLDWIISGEDLAALRADNAGLARRFFDGPGTFVIGSADSQDQVPHGYRSIPALSYASLRSFVSDVHSGGVDAGIAAVLYDPEHWSRTPDAERQQPVRAMCRFTTFARRWGYGPILSPGRDLTLDADSACSKGSHEVLDQAFLRCGLMAPGGEAEAFVVQSAPEELDLGRMSKLIEATRRRLAASGEEVGLFATLSSDPVGGDEAVWPIDLVRAAERAIDAGATGLMLNVAPGDVELAVSFLRDLERAGPVDGTAVARAD